MMLARRKCRPFRELRGRTYRCYLLAVLMDGHRCTQAADSTCWRADHPTQQEPRRLFPPPPTECETGIPTPPFNPLRKVLRGAMYDGRRDADTVLRDDLGCAGVVDGVADADGECGAHKGGRVRRGWPSGMRRLQGWWLAGRRAGGTGIRGRRFRGTCFSRHRSTFRYPRTAQFLRRFRGPGRPRSSR
jgi:hypothetical protein